ncbi:MAG: threonine--tRNA ligase [Pseudomonadales bacterium]|jgi:threonyl-tRNA synthetase|nr:threonine--tRNA ligase [Pseudomonadales bacterium]
MSSDQELAMQLEKMRHSAEHVLTYVLMKMYGPDKVIPAMGPATAEGFYFDFEKDPDLEINAGIFPKVEKEMQKIINANWQLAAREMLMSEALDFFKINPYKSETLEELGSEGEEKVTIYILAPAEKIAELSDDFYVDTHWQEWWDKGYFVDLCKGPHVEKLTDIKVFRLLRVAGAYWRGDENNQMLTRIYGTAFANKEELEQYLDFLEEAKKRDHKRIGKEQGLFSFEPTSPGCVLWHEKGMVIWDIMEQLGQSIRKKYGFVKIKTPVIAKSELWKTSGHYAHYKDDMFILNVDDHEYCIKPMDCPFNLQIFNSGQKSYRDMPVRYTEIGHVYRNEKSGELNGLFRVREITQDDSHILCTEDQVGSEIKNIIQMVKEYYGILDVEPKFFLSTMPDDHMGEVATWERAEEALRNALADENIDYDLKEKDGAFYGPKIDVDIKDALGRSWQVATIQLDFQLPGRFGCEYVDSDGERKTPVLIHNATFGSFERMIGMLIEHHAGRFPAWLAPVQIKLLPIADRHVETAVNLQKDLEGKGWRVEVDGRVERLPAKIRDAQMEQVPYMVVIGDNEIESGKYSVRVREGGEVALSELTVPSIAT